MKPGIMPTESGVRQLERKNRLRAAAGEMQTCSVCTRVFASDRPRVLYGKWPTGYVGGPLCSISCTERAVARVAKANP